MQYWKAYLAAFVLSVIAALAFVPLFGGTAKRGMLTRNLSYAKQLALGAKLYALDYDGRYPVHLSELMPDYIPVESWDRLLFTMQKDKNQDPAPPFQDWLYFGAFTDQDHPPRILIASPQAIGVKGKNRRVIAAGDTSASIVFEEEYQAELAKMIVELRLRRDAMTPAAPDGDTSARPTEKEDEALAK